MRNNFCPVTHALRSVRNLAAARSTSSDWERRAPGSATSASQSRPAVDGDRRIGDGGVPDNSVSLRK